MTRACGSGRPAAGVIRALPRLGGEGAPSFAMARATCEGGLGP